MLCCSMNFKKSLTISKIVRLYQVIFDFSVHFTDYSTSLLMDYSIINRDRISYPTLLLRQSKTLAPTVLQRSLANSGRLKEGRQEP